MQAGARARDPSGATEGEPAPLLGLIAGEGELPLEIARAAREGGRRVHALAFHGVTHPDLVAAVDALDWFHLGEVGGVLARLRAAAVRDVVMAGKVEKSRLFEPLGELRPDARALELLAAFRDRGDETILGSLARLLEDEGLTLLPQAELVPALLAEEGRLGRIEPTAGQLEDVAFGWPIARTIAGCDVGQCVVVRQGAVLAVEAIEGTDAAVARAGALGGEGACVIKLARPGQDRRVDLPAVGPRTLDAMIEAGARALAVEAGSTLLLGREELIRKADAHGIALLGVVDGAVPAPSGGGR